MTDAFQDWIISRFDEAAGSFWAVPSPSPYEPRLLSPTWWAERPLHLMLASIGLVLTKDGRRRYWHQLRIEGQGYDDATTYRSRCWAAAFGMPFKPAWESST